MVLTLSSTAPIRTSGRQAWPCCGLQGNHSQSLSSLPSLNFTCNHTSTFIKILNNMLKHHTAIIFDRYCNGDISHYFSGNASFCISFLLKKTVKKSIILPYVWIIWFEGWGLSVAMQCLFYNWYVVTLHGMIHSLPLSNIRYYILPCFDFNNIFINCTALHLFITIQS